jgi:FAD/FMN-containing dehydrogenase/Fe-S oxidoreductase
MAALTSSTRKRPDAVNLWHGDARGLEQALRRTVRGEVRFSEGDRALYATDGSNYRQTPIGVVLPQDANDAVQAMAIARAHDAPVLTRGGGTSLAGQCCNVAVVIDMSKYMHRLRHLDPASKTAVVEPGIVLDSLRDASERHNLTFAPDPSTHTHCTLGGMIGNNSCGVHSVMGGKTDDNVRELEILTYDGLRMRVGPTSDADLAAIIAGGGRRGEIYRALRDLRDRYADQIRARFPDIPRRVSGYNLPMLLPEHGFDVAKALVGSESTCVMVLEATTRLVYSPPVRSLLVLGYPDVYAAGDHVPEILEHDPIGLEGLDDNLVEDMTKKGLHPEDVQLLPDGKGWLLVEFGGESKAESDGKARELMDALRGKQDAPSMKLFDDPPVEKMIWKVRESGLGATARVPGEPDTWEGWEDSAVAPEKLGGYLRDLRALFEKYHYGCSLYGHFGQGCVHTRIDFDLATAPGIATYRSFMDEATDLVLRHGGSLSGEHGDGQSRAEFLPKMFGPELMEAFREFKSIWDPQGRMNPGKIVEPYRIDENLRIGAHYDPPQVATHFQFPDDSGSFARATLRCVGVGNCRQLEPHDGVMCPSFMATREEKHSTRGRARLLFEMLEGDPLSGGWRDGDVREALDLCLACKGCKHDCPVNVDMATYKAEFLSHYYERRIRPRAAYSMGLIYWWSRLAARAPGFANALLHAPVLGGVGKWIAGVAGERTMPRFAERTFAASFKEKARGRGRVVLWTDTFNNNFFPDTLAAGAEVLDAAGFDVELPGRSLCCGRPLYDWGMLGAAKGLLREILDTLHETIAAGVPVVVLEPSCLAVFRDELPGMFPADQDAMRLSRQSYLLGEFLAKHAPDFKLPKLEGAAIVQGHCHHKSLVGMDDETRALDQMGLRYEQPESGCCGMAGAFGFGRGEHYDVSMRIGERALLPAVRASSPETMVIADGFSCREQIEQGTGRPAMHVAEAMRMALRAQRGGSAPDDGARRDEREAEIEQHNGHHGRERLVAAGIAGAAVAGTVAWEARRRRSH